MATNEILRFAETDTGTNLLTQSEYAADSQRPIGNQPGVARSKLVNKALRQSSLIAAGIAEFISDKQANNITDSLTPQNIADYFEAAILSSIPSFTQDGYFYKIDATSVAFSKTGNGTATVKAGTIVDVAGTQVEFSTATSITMPSLSSGTDYAVWVKDDATIHQTAFTS